MRERKEPEIGEKYIWNDKYQPSIEDVEVRVVEVEDFGVTVNVLDEDKLQSAVRSARKTYQKNGRNLDNVLEVCPLVRYNYRKEDFVPIREHLILRAGARDSFEEDFEKK